MWKDGKALLRQPTPSLNGLPLLSSYTFIMHPACSNRLMEEVLGRCCPPENPSSEPSGVEDPRRKFEQADAVSHEAPLIEVLALGA